MPNAHIKYLTTQRDHKGRTVWYVRRRQGAPKHRMPGPPGSPGFEAAYFAAIEAADSLALRPELKRPKQGYVYFLRCPSGIKIGFSAQPWKRIDSMQTAMSEPIATVVIVPGRDEDEKMVHQEFRRFRVRGEWFRPATPILKAMARVAARSDIRYAFEREATPRSQRENGSTVEAETV